ncbi:MAG: hypothetical protein K0B84_07765 [Firmicutes bacterium]|nr:hypothetical protein [Bacillota bacterium]
MFKNSAGKNLVLLALLVLMLLMFPAGLAGAQNGTAINEDINKAVGDLEIPRGTIVNGNVTLNIGELTVLGVINGNVNSNMGQVTIGGDVNGNVETNMGQVVITGNVSGNVKTRMGEVIIDGSVGGNVDSDLGAADIGGSVGGDIGSGFGELKVAGTVAGDIYSKGGNIIITGIVEGDVTLEQGVVELGPSAIVSGRISVARGAIKKADTALVGAVEIGEELTFAELKEEESNNGYSFEGVDSNFVDSIADRIVDEVNRGFRNVNFMPHMNRDWSFYRTPFFNFYGNTARGIINMLIMFALAALTYTLFPKQVRASGAALPHKPGPVIGWGILVAILAVPLMVLLAITIIGIPLIIVEIIFLAAVFILGYSGIALLIGGKVIDAASSKSANPLGAIALGVLILGLVGMIPILGGLIMLALLVLAVGSALVTRFGTINPEPAEAVPAVDEASDTDSV